MATATPTKIELLTKQRCLNLSYADGSSYSLSAEYLRVQSPSAEVRGHGEGQAILQVGKRNVGITNLEAVGNYGLKIYFDDGHNTGIYTWPYLKDLGEHETAYWEEYLRQLSAAGASRD